MIAHTIAHVKYIRMKKLIIKLNEHPYSLRTLNKFYNGPVILDKMISLIV